MRKQQDATGPPGSGSCPAYPAHGSAFPCGLVRRGGDVMVAGREEFFLLELDPFPRRVPEHHVETTALEHLRELKPPMKEVQPVAQLID
jgi:hypothetical protein